MSLKSISFTIWRPTLDKDRPEGLSSVIFNLGMGPCGRFVESIESTIDYHGVTIKQVSYPDDYGHVKEPCCAHGDAPKADWENATGSFHSLRTRGWAGATLRQ